MEFIHPVYLDALKNEVNALNSKLESTATVQLGLVPASPTPMREDTWGNSENTWVRDALVSETSIAPTIDEPSQPLSATLTLTAKTEAGI